MTATKIKAALAQVHASERRTENPKNYERAIAARHAIASHALTDDESAVLLRALHVDASEVQS